MSLVLEEEGRAEQPELRAELADVTEGRDREVERAEVEAFDLLRRVTELGRREHVDRDRAARRFRDALREALRGEVVGMAARLIVSEPQLDPRGIARTAGDAREVDGRDEGSLHALHSIGPAYEGATPEPRAAH